jgi:hypothetical protein
MKERQRGLARTQCARKETQLPSQGRKRANDYVPLLSLRAADQHTRSRGADCTEADALTDDPGEGALDRGAIGDLGRKLTKPAT